jgi:hypothetical protein
VLRDLVVPPLAPLHDRQQRGTSRPETCPRTPRAHRTEPAEDTLTLDELERIVAALDDAHFGGSVPWVRVVLDADLPATVDGQYRYIEDVIALRPGLSRSRAVSVLAHELTHASVDAVHPGLELRDPHGTIFQKVAALVDPSGAPQSQAEAEVWQPAVRVLDIDARTVHRNADRQRTATGMVKALGRGQINDFSRPRGDQTLVFKRGDLVPANHWAVRLAPHRFAR